MRVVGGFPREPRTVGGCFMHAGEACRSSDEEGLSAEELLPPGEKPHSWGQEV